MMKKILVITATLGNRDTLHRTITSVKSIGSYDVHHVIVAPAYIIPDLKNKYGDNLVYESEPMGCRGIYAALNHGFKKYGKNYEYLTFINDDDYWLPQYRNLIDYILMHDKCDFVYGRTMYVDENNVRIGEQTSCSQFKRFIPLLSTNVIMLTQQATIIRSSLFFELGGFDETYKLVADTKFWAVLSLKHLKYKYFNKCCAAYMIQDGQLSSDHSTQAKEHQRLLSELPSKSTISRLYSKIYFRCYNLKIYLKRFIGTRNIKNPFRGG